MLFFLFSDASAAFQSSSQCREKTPKAELCLGLDNWDTEHYRLIHTEQTTMPIKASSTRGKEEDLTHLKKRRTWTAFTLIAEIARYMNTSPLLIERLLRESVEGISAVLTIINEHNELLYDKLIPVLFAALYDVISFEQKEEREVTLIRESEKGFYTVHGDPTKTDIFKEWQSSRAEQAAKSFHLDTYCFDSTSEQDFFHNVIRQHTVAEIYFTGMLTHGQSDFHINYIDPENHNVRSYYPDFLVRTTSGEWLVIEVKANYEMGNAVVQAKKDFAERMLKSSGISYRMVGHTEAGVMRI